MKKQFELSRALRVFISILILSFFLAGCQTAYYAAWEKLGKEKRHLLRDNVSQAKEEQEEASEQFTDVLTRIKTLYGFDGGELESFYDKLKNDYEECDERASAVSERIRKVELIAKDLFKEWQKEINEISNSKLKLSSRKQMIKSKAKYSKLHASLVKAEKSMTPVLRNLKDYVLYLKHNLNAEAVGTLKAEADDIELEISSLISDMNKSIKEAEKFVKDF